MKIRLSSYKSSIQEKPLSEVLENESTLDGQDKRLNLVQELQHFMRTRYFLLSDESGFEALQLLDSLKII